MSSGKTTAIVPKERRAPYPEFQTPRDIEAKLPKDLVLDDDTFNQARSGSTSPLLEQWYNKLGLRSPEEKSAFRKSQLRLKMQKANPNPEKKEE